MDAGSPVGRRGGQWLAIATQTADNAEGGQAVWNTIGGGVGEMERETGKENGVRSGELLGVGGVGQKQFTRHGNHGDGPCTRVTPVSPMPRPVHSARNHRQDEY